VIGLIAAGVGILVIAVVGVTLIGFLTLRARPVPLNTPPEAPNWPVEQLPGPPGEVGISTLPGPAGQAAEAFPGMRAPASLQPLPDPAPPAQALPLASNRPEEIVPVGNLETNVRLQSFDERAPEGGVLVGLRLIKGMNWGGAICGVQAIYQVGDMYSLGASFEPGGGVEQREFLAKPGYAVAAIQCRSGLSLNAVQIEFRRVMDRGLDPNDAYRTEWYGCEGGGVQPLVDGDGSFLVGLRGTSHSDLGQLASYRLLELGSPATPLPKLAATQDGERSQAGNAFGNEFTDAAPEGGLLVGFRVFQGQNWGGAIRGIQPIYQVGDRYQLGKAHGQPGGTIFQLLAPPGYGVGKIEADTGLVFDGLQIRWHLVKDDGTLDPTNEKSSKYVGVRGGQITLLDTRGRPIRAVFGRYQEDLNQLGIIAAQP